MDKMKEMALEFLVCVIVAALLMIVHEFVKSAVYIGLQKKSGSKRVYAHKIWEVHRYVDPLGILLSITSSVTFSRPFMFRIRDKKTNLILGITGFTVLLLCFVGSITALKLHFMGVQGMTTLMGHGIGRKIVSLFLQYTAIISLGMFVANLFPISTFDMGLVIAGISSEKYLNIIKMDAVIKVIFVLTLLVDLIHYGNYHLIQWLL